MLLPKYNIQYSNKVKSTLIGAGRYDVLTCWITEMKSKRFTSKSIPEGKLANLVSSLRLHSASVGPF